MDDETLVKAILWIVEGIVEQKTTERVFYDYDSDGELTSEGEIAAELIKILLKIQKGAHKDGIIYSDEEQGS